MEKTIDNSQPNDDKSHLDIGRDLKLFTFNAMSPGSCFFLPHGTRLYNALMEMLRCEYKKRGYDEIISPNIFSSELWKISGHWDHYKDNMFTFNIKDIDENNQEANYIYGLKAMNCPGHCLIYKSDVRSYKNLPLKLAEFGVLHRNEMSGSLRGLTRVRRFVQDDAHIFCTHNQIQQQIIENLDFLDYVYKKLGFNYRVTLSTRPDKFMGNIDVWESAENNLIEALNAKKIKYNINDKDGAFYGPKIDIMVKDSKEKEHQCGTIQLDFQLPCAFDLKYVDEDGSKKQPVIIHRAILGSIERMIAVLLENSGGKLPFWCSPRQIMIIPINPTVYDYCHQVLKELQDKNMYVDFDLSDAQINYKIRAAEVLKYNNIIVIGNKEMDNNTINLRISKKINMELKLDNFINEYCKK